MITGMVKGVMRIRYVKTEYVSLSCPVSVRPGASLLVHMLKELTIRGLSFIRRSPFFMCGALTPALVTGGLAVTPTINREYVIMWFKTVLRYHIKKKQDINQCAGNRRCSFGREGITISQSSTGDGRFEKARRHSPDKLA